MEIFQYMVHGKNTEARFKTNKQTKHYVQTTFFDQTVLVQVMLAFLRKHKIGTKKHVPAHKEDLHGRCERLGKKRSGDTMSMQYITSALR